MMWSACRAHGAVAAARGHGAGHAGAGAPVQLPGAGSRHLRLPAPGARAPERLRRAGRCQVFQLGAFQEYMFRHHAGEYPVG